MQSQASNPSFEAIFSRLRRILEGYAAGTLILHNEKAGNMELVGPATPHSLGREVWFGAVRIGKRYVSYYLMPVYAFPDLLDGISPELKKRMQGKSCFNFTREDEQLFAELAELTERGYQRYRQEKWVE
jgi:hypothetical protein